MAFSGALSEVGVTCKTPRKHHPGRGRMNLYSLENGGVHTRSGLKACTVDIPSMF